eukprot:3240204-Rhodomonas_salina.1
MIAAVGGSREDVCGSGRGSGRGDGRGGGRAGGALEVRALQAPSPVSGPAHAPRRPSVAAGQCRAGREGGVSGAESMALGLAAQLATAQRRGGGGGCESRELA